ncbi:hypothetical protein [Aestuariivirga litoralis]|uniref:hypothetical protein n=1 Tax=Aestuariivirga litoralis TaxID=2650924 RepID=UPI0018C84345|nr:hypothetical protein [Aestuariivirga litoralis]MBG1232764.1 hypothetical protein [Aestuariivirga litoralis]
MQKVMPGTSHASFRFVMDHARELVRISLMPAGLFLIMTGLQLKSMFGFFEFIETMVAQGDKPDPAIFFSMFRSIILLQVAGLLSALSMCWLFVRVVRFRTGTQIPTFGISKGEIESILMVILYVLGIAALTMLVYMGAALVIGIGAAIIAAIVANTLTFQEGDLTFLFFLIPAIIMVVVALMFGLMVFACRYAVGLPAVAMGKTPDFFATLWPLARGESFALPLRLAACSIVVAIPLLLISLIFLWPIWSQIMAMQGQSSPPPHFMTDIFKSIMPVQIIAMLLQVPLIWFFGTLFTEAYARFTARNAQA